MKPLRRSLLFPFLSILQHRLLWLIVRRETADDPPGSEQPLHTRFSEGRQCSWVAASERAKRPTAKGAGYRGPLEKACDTKTKSDHRFGGRGDRRESVTVRYYDHAKAPGVGFIEMLELRPFGGFLSSENADMLTSEDREKLVAFYRAGCTSRRYNDLLILFYVAYIERPDEPGCLMGGLSHLHIDSMGNVNPCAMLPVTSGNIMEEDFPPPDLRPDAKGDPAPVHKESPSVGLAKVIREQSGNGRLTPVPFKAVEEEWQALFS